MNFNGIIFGLFATLAIGIGFVWVIKLEYYVGAHVTKWVAILGIILMLSTLFISSFVPSAIVGILSGTIIWGATEMPDQEKRVAAGMFPANPNKKASGKGK